MTDGTCLLLLKKFHRHTKHSWLLIPGFDVSRTHLAMLEYLAAYISLQTCYKVMRIKAMAYIIPLYFVRVVQLLNFRGLHILTLCFRSIVNFCY